MGGVSKRYVDPKMRNAISPAGSKLHAVLIDAMPMATVAADYFCKHFFFFLQTAQFTKNEFAQVKRGDLFTNWWEIMVDNSFVIWLTFGGAPTQPK